MTLSALANLVCEKVRKTDPESLDACKGFLRQRHEMIYDAALWKDTLGVVNVSLEVGAEGFAPVTTFWRREVVLPGTVERVLQVRWNDDDTELQPDSLGHWMTVDPSTFEDLGAPCRFTEIDSVGLAWTPDQLGGQLVFAPLDSRDAGITVQIDGVVIVTNKSEDLTLTAGSTPTVQTNWTSVRAISKPVTYGDIYVTMGSHGMYFASHQTISRHARIRLDRVPEYDATATTPSLLVLAKKRLTSFVRDSDAPMIRGSDNALIALAQADMLERERQYGKAQAKIAEAQALLLVMFDTEKHQGAGVTRLTPTVESTAGGVEDFGW